jgi:gamma-glutamyltranspeptidase/glutathione hydrolase
LRVVLSFIVFAILFASCKEKEKLEAIKSKYDCGMVVSAHAEASRVGTEIMNQGGNAIDAAIAIHCALAVTYPVAGNLGGGGFAVIRTVEGENLSLDFREVASILLGIWMN